VGATLDPFDSDTPRHSWSAKDLGGPGGLLTRSAHSVGEFDPHALRSFMEAVRVDEEHDSKSCRRSDAFARADLAASAIHGSDPAR